MVSVFRMLTQEVTKSTFCVYERKVHFLNIPIKVRQDGTKNDAIL
jgi:hypothetical protein